VASLGHRDPLTRARPSQPWKKNLKRKSPNIGHKKKQGNKDKFDEIMNSHAKIMVFG
jgi:hypothetical protein